MGWTLTAMLYMSMTTLLQNCLPADAWDTSQSNCQRLTTINYHYSSPYHLPDMDGDKDADGITFHFKVRAASDGHLRLASSPDAKQSPVTVEVIIGAGANTFSAVRRKPKKTPLDYTVNTLRVLSKEEFRSFTLILKGRNLTLYANNTNDPFIFYQEDSLMDMKYISFGSWNNVEVEWSFDCKGAEVQEPLPTNPLLRLKRKLDQVRPPFPNTTLMVGIALRIVHVHLDAKTSWLTLRTNFEEKWEHEKLHWNPEEFGNITQIKSKSGFWVPSLQVLDVPGTQRSNDYDYRHLQISVNHDGPVRYRFYSDVLTLCEVDVTYWPSDEHVCEIHLGLGPGQENVGLEVTGTQIELDTAVSEWEILSIISSTVTDVDDKPPQSFKLRITLKRVCGSYFVLFVIPLFMAFTMLIASFMIAPQHNETRLMLVSASVVTLHLLLYVEQSLLPALPQSSPRIMNTTSSLLVMGMLHLIFHCFNVHVANLDIPPPRILSMLFKKRWMKHLYQETYEVFSTNDEQEGATDQEETSHNENHSPSNGSPEQDGVTIKYRWAFIARCLDMITFTLSFLILPFILNPI